MLRETPDRKLQATTAYKVQATIHAAPAGPGVRTRSESLMVSPRGVDRRTTVLSFIPLTGSSSHLPDLVLAVGRLHVAHDYQDSMSTLPSSILSAAAVAAVACFYVRNHRRVRAAKSCLRAFVLRPAADVPRRPYPVIFLAGTAQKSSVWRRQMELLTSAGYECHALDFVQTGRYLSSMADQVSRMREYIVEKIDGRRPILIGHSMGGCRAQCYMLAADGDASVTEEAAVRAVVLMAANEASFVGSFPDVLRQLVATAGVARALAAGLLGLIFLDPICFSFGGGPYRHWLRTYEDLFNPHTKSTSLMSVQGLKDARIDWSGNATDGRLPISVWADAYLSDHEPVMTDLGVVRHGRSASDALAAHGCEVLHLVAADDRVMPRAQSRKVAETWKTASVVVDGQGHQFGDAGWERSLMGPLRAFLDGLT